MIIPVHENDVCQAKLFDELGFEDHAALAELKANGAITVLDQSGAQRAELQRILPVPSDGILSEPGRWVHYPWRRTVISILGPNAFRLLRLDRNRNKITREEQDRCAKLTIGIVGLSVGHAIAHTLALEGLCGQIRLADYDTIQLSNLNRIPATVFDLGLNKSVVAARRIAELDPYLPVRILPDGITSSTMSGFFDGLDLVIEECDSLDMKLLIREAARDRQIPVIMATSDRGLLDVERFDLEPARPLFHGLLGDLTADALAGLPAKEKVTHILRILEASSVSARMAASMIEVGESITIWPQLGGDVLQGAATVAAAVRRLGRGEDLPSGRVRIDVDRHLDQLCDPSLLEACSVAAPNVDNDLRLVPDGAVDAVIHAVRLAPSGGNAQPWSVSADSDALRIHLATERTSLMDVQYRGSYVAIGAALHNARVAASANGILGPAEIRAAGPDSDLVATLYFGSDHEPELTEQYDAMLRRRSNRNFGLAAPLDVLIRDAMTLAAERSGGRLHLLTDRASVAECADILAESDRLRYLTPLLHKQMTSELRWPGRDRLDLGIDVSTLELGATDLAKLEVLSRADVMAQLTAWVAGRALGAATRDRVNSSSALAIITTEGVTPTDYVRGGTAVQDVWICAEQHGLAVQPVSPVFLFASTPSELEALSAPFAGKLAELQRAFIRTVGVQPGQAIALVLRLSHAPPATVRSQRLALHAISRVLDSGVATGGRVKRVRNKHSLEELVTAVASELMAVDAATVLASSQWVLRELVSYFNVDLSFLRRNDHDLGASVLVAEWPPRPQVPDPDPLGVVLFAEADAVFSSTEHLSHVMITRPDQATNEYQRRVFGGSGVMGVSSATVPLISRGATTGVLGFIKYGDREWTQAEVNALKAIAALLAQMQARIAAEERLRYLAYHDELTGLSNRRALLDHLTKRLLPGERGPVAVLFLDLDRLKAMNDFLGHAAGDQFLQSVATRLQTQRCPGDLVARLGGDEFVVVLGPPTGAVKAERVAVAVQRLVNEPVRLDGEEVSRRVSIGVAVAHPGHCTVSGLLGQADQAVMSAKAQGGNGIVAFTEEMRAQNEVRTDIELHLRGAIHDDALVLHYQPEIDLRTGELLGAEALVRWNHPTRGLLQPDSFIGVAEATNLAGELGRWVLGTACAQLSKWQTEFSDLNLCVRINVSPAQLITLDFVTDVAQSLEKHNIDGRYLSLEITEHAVVGDIDRTLETLRRLKDIGVRVAIDDFGTGYSSLAQLKALPVDALKIDQSFVQDLGSNRDDLAIVQSIVSLAASFGLDTVAEGVATEIAARTLVELGCFRAQGYLISVPVPAEELWPVLRRGYIPLASLEG